MITEISYNSLLEEMNRLGEAKTPFVFAINFEKSFGFILPHPENQTEVLYSTQKYSNSSSPSPKRVLTLKAMPESFEIYSKRFDRVMKGLKRGDTFLTNLTVRTPISLSHNLEEVFLHSKAKYKMYLKDKWVCFSPETFITIDEAGNISSHPMKGTIDATIPNAENIILSDYKETAEHHTIVDLIRNDLNVVAENVRVEKFRYIDKIVSPQGELLQVSSTITGKLPKDWRQNLGSIIDKLLPAGSISGAPKEATLQIIREAEQLPRGYYTGIMGIFDGETVDTGVIIRYIEKEGASYFFRSGGGITINASAENEYREVSQKIYIPHGRY
ncbi:MAG: aminodeoxychorismate synthase component I [Porphyromonas sp.]|nr:aminodeoxychorismate synthase component I [Porphyromonas sp.]